MASPLFEMEETDEDFFDKLIDDVDIDYVHSSVKKVELDEVKDFSKLSISGVDASVNASSQFSVELGQKDGVMLESFDSHQDPVTVEESQSNALAAKVEETAVDDAANKIIESVSGTLGQEDEFYGELGHQDGVLSELSPPRQDSVVAEESMPSVHENSYDESEDKGEKGAVDGTMSKSVVSVGTGVKVVQWSSFNSDFNPYGGSGFGSNLDFYSEVGDNSDDPFANLGNAEQSGAKSIVTNGFLDNSDSGLGTSSYEHHQEDPFANLGNTEQFGVKSNVTNAVKKNSISGLDTSNYVQHPEDPFANLGNIDQSGAASVTNGVLENSDSGLVNSRYGQHLEDQWNGATEDQNLDGQELNSSQNWEDLYPGWRYDQNTQQWFQLEGYDVNANTNADVHTNSNAHESFNLNSQSEDTAFFSDQKEDPHSLQQAVQSVAQSVVEATETSTSANLNQHSYGNTEYPAHIVFDPQYPGWYYDTIAQEWRQLESADPAFDQSTSVVHNQQNHHTNIEEHVSQSLGIQQSVTNWDGTMSTYDQQNASVWHSENLSKSDTSGFTEEKLKSFTPDFDQSTAMLHNHNTSVDNYGSQSLIVQQSNSNWNRSVSSNDQHITSSWHTQHQDQAKEINQVMHFTPANFGILKPAQFFQQPLQNVTQSSHEAREGRSSAGRPPHALVTFGFGGKLIVMKNDSSFANQTYGSQGSEKGVINVLNLMEVVMEKGDAASLGPSGCDYFRALCQQSFPGPLVGGNVGNKELNKWIDDKIANCETPYMDLRKGDHLRLLFSLLKISWQFYGKLRSPFGTDPGLKENDSPESAVAKLFASAKRNNEYGALMQCLQNLPSEAQMQATALEVQKLLVSGRKNEALEYAQGGQLWGLALVIASQLGDQFYCDTMKRMALNQLTSGSPLRTLCLLIARQPAEVFSNASHNSSVPSFVNVPQQHAQVGANYMLEEWEENLAILTANRTKDDELVIIHLGDCLWKDKGQITAAHICYLVAEANFEQYSNSSRLCLIGADHWKFPRTYASPEAIQRTELYEYSKVAGNPQFLLLPFQPYKLIYAHMLAEVGKVADALKYCQAILKSLKTGRAPEMDTWRELVSSLEERIRAHQQGGYSINLAPTKLMGKLLTFIDTTTHRVVGGLPPPVPSTAPGFVQPAPAFSQPAPAFSKPAPAFSQPAPAFFQPAPAFSQSAPSFVQPAPGFSQSAPSFVQAAPGFSQRNEHSTTNQLGDPGELNSQSTTVMSPLMPSVSMEPISERTSESNEVMPNRSISEPDFGKSPTKDSSKKGNSSKVQEKPSSRFGSFGSQIFQKTLGLVIKSRPDKQAKLGETNKFYYDEKLKRWVEEGAEPPAEEAALPPPPPTTAAIQNRVQDYNMNDALKTNSFHAVNGPEIKSPASSEQSSGIPLIPSSSNQFSQRGRMGVRSRYVDTFNKGGASSGNLFQSPPLPAAKPGGGSIPKMFIPNPVISQEVAETTAESTYETFVTDHNPPKSTDTFSTAPTSTPSMHRFPSNNIPKSVDTFPIPSTSTSSMQRFPSVDNIVQKRSGEFANGSSFVPPELGRAASWSGSISDASNSSMRSEIKSTGKSHGMSPLSYMPYVTPSMQLQRSSGSFGDDLDEVEL